MQENQNSQQTRKRESREATNASCTKQTIKDNQNNGKTDNLQTMESNSKKKSGIDVSLPNPKTPNLINVVVGHTEEVIGGTDGGCK